MVYAFIGLAMEHSTYVNDWENYERKALLIHLHRQQYQAEAIQNGQLAFNGAILCRYYFICNIIILLLSLHVQCLHSSAVRSKEDSAARSSMKFIRPTLPKC